MMMTTEQIEQIGHDLADIADRVRELAEENDLLRSVLEEIADLGAKFDPDPDDAPIPDDPSSAFDFGEEVASFKAASLARGALK